MLITYGTPVKRRLVSWSKCLVWPSVLVDLHFCQTFHKVVWRHVYGVVWRSFVTNLLPNPTQKNFTSQSAFGEITSIRALTVFGLQ